jgi:hypothetical protein
MGRQLIVIEDGRSWVEHSAALHAAHATDLVGLLLHSGAVPRIELWGGEGPFSVPEAVVVVRRASGRALVEAGALLERYSAYHYVESDRPLTYRAVLGAKLCRS